MDRFKTYFESHIPLSHALRILGLKSLQGQTAATIKSIYRIKSRRVHPDAGGSDRAFVELRNAYERVQQELVDKPPTLSSHALVEISKSVKVALDQSNNVPLSNRVEVAKCLVAAANRLIDLLNETQKIIHLETTLGNGWYKYWARTNKSTRDAYLMIIDDRAYESAKRSILIALDNARELIRSTDDLVYRVDLNRRQQERD
jgi:hypothetical protein